jgi:FkbM family methyltransferase
MSNRTTAVYLGDHTALTRTALGHKLYVDTRDISLAPHLLMDGEWEMWITRAFEGLVRPGMTVVDIGANVGWYTLAAAQGVGPEGRVVAFEANPRLAGLVRKSVEINGFWGRTTVEAQAVTDHRGELTLHVLRDHQGSSTITAADVGAAWGDASTPVTVPCTTLDDYADEHGLRIDVLKIDAEGAEPAIIAGARRVLQANPDIQVLMEYGPANRPALEELLELGFEVRAIDTESGLVDLSPEDFDGETHFDMLHLVRPLPAVEEPPAQSALGGVTLVAFADEVLGAPAMLRDFAGAFGGDHSATLILYAPDQDAAALRERLVPAVEAAGLGACRAAVEALAVPGSPDAEAALVAGADALFTSHAAPGAFAALPTLDGANLRALVA